MKKIIFVCHCILNPQSKVESFKTEATEEELNRKKFLKICLENDISLVQLPCPEQLQLGLNRWGHSREQFNFPGFRDGCNSMLKDPLKLLREYETNEEIEVLGIVGINGSPSCGVDFSFSAPFKGEISRNENLDEMIKSGTVVDKPGIFIEVLKENLEKYNIDTKIVPIDEETVNKLDIEGWLWKLY